MSQIIRQRPVSLDRFEAEKNVSKMLTEDSKLQDNAHKNALTRLRTKCNYY